MEDILEDTEKRMFQLLQRRNSGEYVPIRQVVLNALETIERASQTKGTVTGIPSGFVDLDYKTSDRQRSGRKRVSDSIGICGIRKAYGYYTGKQKVNEVTKYEVIIDWNSIL